MPLVIPRFVQARDLLSATVAGGTQGSDGTITWGTASELSVRNSGSGTFKAFEFSGDPQHERFMPSDLVVANYQIEFDDWNFTAREITPANGAGVLTTLWTTKDFLRFDYVYRPRNLVSGAGIRLVVVGTRAPIRIPFGAGENVQEVTIKPIGWPVYIGTSTDTPPF